MADLANAQDRNARLTEENRLLRERLSAPELEQGAVELRRQLEECQEDLDAARSINREYMARVNGSPVFPS